jgi:mRNA interferase HigB
MCWVICENTLSEFWARHPETKASLRHWLNITQAANWKSMSEVQASYSNVVVLNGERARFEVAGGNYRLIVAFKFTTSSGSIAFVKFIGTHEEYDRVDALTVSQF